MSQPTLSQLLSNSRPDVATSIALLALDLQNDFLSSDGKLPVHLPEGFEKNIADLVPSFRQTGQVIWARTEYSPNQETSRDAVVALSRSISTPEPEVEEEDSEDEFIRVTLEGNSSPLGNRPSAKRTAELLRRAAGRSEPRQRSPPKPAPAEDLFLAKKADVNQQCCQEQSEGAQLSSWAKSIRDEIKDFTITKRTYSAFNSTSLLMALRLRMITKIYLCGSLTNISVYATARDAVSHGFQVAIVQDCLGYRCKEAHDQASMQMECDMGVECVTVSELAKELRAPIEPAINPKNTTCASETNENALISRMGNMTISAVSANHSNSQTLVDETVAREEGLGLANILQAELLSSRPPAASFPDFSNIPPSAASDSTIAGVSSTNCPPHPGLPSFMNMALPSMPTDATRPATGAPQPSLPAFMSMARPTTIIDATQTEPSVGVPATQALPVQSTPLPTGAAVPARPNFSSNDPRMQHSPATNLLPGSLTAPSDNHVEVLQSSAKKVKAALTTRPCKLPGDDIGEGDSRVLYDCMSEAKSDLFSTLKNEVHWQKMLHARGEVPRLVCVQGVFGKTGSMPVYRHPSDQSLPLLHLSPAVQNIQRAVETEVGHSMNHVLIQLYRTGEDYISEHSDKTLDIIRGSSIVNVSLGAQRTMRLRTKRPAKEERVDQEDMPRQTQLVPMPNGSMFILGPQTNKAWLHGINHDKRPFAQKSDAEKVFGGERISLTFRNIGTYLDSESRHIWGQGACSKHESDAKPVVNGNPEMTQQVINAFGYENQETAFDWDDVYGRGFDVLNFSQAADESPLLFLSGNYVCDMKVRIFLEELGINYRVGGVQSYEAGVNWCPEICFRDKDAQKTQVYGDVPILLYLARTAPQKSLPEPIIAESCSQLWKLRDILGVASPHTSLAQLDEVLRERQYIAGDTFSIADCAYWPVVDEMLETWEPWNPEKFPNIAAFHKRVLSRPSVKSAMWSESDE